MRWHGRGRGSAPPSPTGEWEPVVDKNPHYRTHDIFNRIYKKKLKLEKSNCNKTDCSTTIWVKFSDPMPRAIIQDLGKKNERTQYLLECGHEWSGKNAFDIGKSIPCHKCGAQQSYYGFEHEWQHIIFKSNPIAEKLFIDAWAKELHQQAPHVDIEQLHGFLRLMINAFDDIRCNSLWEKVYPGSADNIWARWRRLTEEAGEKGINTNFIGFMFATAFGIPTDPNGPYAHAKATIDWGMQHVRYKGFVNMLTIAKLSLDSCLASLLARVPPQPQKQLQQPQQQQQGTQQGQQPSSSQSGGQQQGASGSDDSQDDAEGDPGDSGSSSQGGEVHGDTANGGALGSTDQGTSSGSIRGGEEKQPSKPPKPDADLSDLNKNSDALSKMIRHAKPVDKEEEHHIPTPFDMIDVPASTQAMVAKALTGKDVPPAGTTDDEMDDALSQLLQQSGTQVSKDSQLISDARAKVLFINVDKAHIDPHSRIKLSTKEQMAVERMKSIFFRTMGKQKASRSSSGNVIDVDAAIQYLIDPSNVDIFELDQNNQGFGYLVLTDMSGSMGGAPFGQVCHAVEMLKKSLKFPFVDGRLWGFRGGQPIKDRPEEGGEVWIYRYDKGCEGYLGKALVSLGKKHYEFPVACGGLTPMHSAIRVSGRYLLTQMASGMAKQLYILTDGSPCGRKVDGRGMPDWLLRDFVAKEVRWLRQKGVRVQTLIIGNELADDDCNKMFGSSRFWKRVDSRLDADSSVDRMLQQLVIQNFERYLKTRG